MELNELRGQIDVIDRELTALFVRRLEAAEEIAKRKAEAGLPVFQPQREEQVLSAVLERTPVAMQEDVALLYDAIFRISRRRQEAK